MQAAQGTPVERLEHGDQVFRQDRFLLARRGDVFVANAGHDGGDGAIPAIEFLRAALGIVPADGGKTPLTVRLMSRRRRLAARRRSMVETLFSLPPRVGVPTALPEAQAVM